MNNRIIIKSQDNRVIFEGCILDIPIKESYIINKSIEIFNDEDPCIIHRSYVIKNIVDDFLKYSGLEKKTKVKLSDCDKEKITFLDIPQVDKDILYLGE